MAAWAQDEFALACAGLNGGNYVNNPTLAYYLSLLRLVALVRRRQGLPASQYASMSCTRAVGRSKRRKGPRPCQHLSISALLYAPAALPHALCISSSCCFPVDCLPVAADRCAAATTDASPAPPRPPASSMQLRCYRLFWFFSFLTYSLATPLLLVTLVRNVLASSAPRCLFWLLLFLSPCLAGSPARKRLRLLPGIDALRKVGPPLAFCCPHQQEPCAMP